MGAFVIGLAGTILVTGIAPYVVQGTAARAGRGAAGLVGRPDQPGRRPPSWTWSTLLS